MILTTESLPSLSTTVKLLMGFSSSILNYNSSVGLLYGSDHAKASAGWLDLAEVESGLLKGKSCGHGL